MIIDKEASPSFLPQPILAATVVSVDSYDNSMARDIGRGQEVRFIVTVAAALVSGTSLQAQLIEADNAALTVGVNVLESGPVVPVASLVAGAVVADLTVPRTTKRYFGLQYVPVGAFTAGSVVGNLALDTDSRVVFPFISGF